MVGVGGVRAGGGRFCVQRGRLAVVTGHSAGSIYQSEPGPGRSESQFGNRPEGAPHGAPFFLGNAEGRL